MRAKGYSENHQAYLQIKIGGTEVFAGTKFPFNTKDAESWVETLVTAKTAGAMTVAVVWPTVATSSKLYLNEFEIVKLENVTPEYQYNLKDHLGNVRMTFTTKEEIETSLATMETAQATTEESNFLYYSEAVKVNAQVFDHTDAGTTWYSTRLNGSTNERTGLAKSLSVMPGDEVNAEVYVKYLDPNSSNWTAAMNSLITSIANGTAPANTFIDGGSPGSTGGVTAPHLGALNKSGETGTAPKAYLNYIIFDRDYVIKDGGFVRVTTAAREYGQDGIHEKLSASITVSEPGYIYLYLSNDNLSLGGGQVEVYFDDFKVEHVKSPVVSSQDFYPFGAGFCSFTRENSAQNKFGYNGKESQDELSLSTYDYGARFYDPMLNRWSVIDGKAELYFANSPYTYALNQPTNAIDPDGNLVIFINGNHYGDGGSREYWRTYKTVSQYKSYSLLGQHFWSGMEQRRVVDQDFAGSVMSQVGDYHSIYRDGSIGGRAPMNPIGNELVFTRKAAGYLQGKEDARAIIENLARDGSGNITESIKIITHSMGGAYGKGYAIALLEYAREHNIEGVSIAFTADFAPFQSGQLEAVTGKNVGPTLQFSHSNDALAGNAKEKGASQQDTSSDKKQDHSIFSFMPQIPKLPTGKYSVVNGHILRDRDRKKKNQKQND